MALSAGCTGVLQTIFLVAFSPKRLSFGVIWSGRPKKSYFVTLAAATLLVRSCFWLPASSAESGWLVRTYWVVPGLLSTIHISPFAHGMISSEVEMGGVNCT